MVEINLCSIVQLCLSKNSGINPGSDTYLQHIRPVKNHKKITSGNSHPADQLDYHIYIKKNQAQVSDKAFLRRHCFSCVCFLQLFFLEMI